jgi:hypothetical protein
MLKANIVTLNEIVGLTRECPPELSGRVSEIASSLARKR